MSNMLIFLISYIIISVYKYIEA